MIEIRLDKSAGIRNISLLYEEMKKNVQRGEDIRIDFSELESLDLSMIQLLISARKSLRLSGKKMLFSNVSEAVKNQMKMTGIIRQEDRAQ